MCETTSTWLWFREISTKGARPPPRTWRWPCPFTTRTARSWRWGTVNVHRRCGSSEFWMGFGRFFQKVCWNVCFSSSVKGSQICFVFDWLKSVSALQKSNVPHSQICFPNQAKVWRFNLRKNVKSPFFFFSFLFFLVNPADNVKTFFPVCLLICCDCCERFADTSKSRETMTSMITGFQL